MIEPRFVVLTTTGYRIPRYAAHHAGGSAREGATATVYDRHWQEEIVAFPSEDQIGNRGQRRGIEGARLAAEEKAAELNLWHEAQG